MCTVVHNKRLRLEGDNVPKVFPLRGGEGGRGGLTHKEAEEEEVLSCCCCCGGLWPRRKLLVAVLRKNLRA